MQGSPQKKESNCYSVCTNPSSMRCRKWVMLAVVLDSVAKSHEQTATACADCLRVCVCVCVCMFSLAVPQLLAVSVHHV